MTDLGIRAGRFAVLSRLGPRISLPVQLVTAVIWLTGFLLCASVSAHSLAQPTPESLNGGAALGGDELGWRASGLGGIRGLTIGPIENALHPDRGYGTAAFGRALDDARRLGSNWVSLTPFGRVRDLTPTGVALSFEQPFAENRRALLRSVKAAHARGLRVLLVPHLWVENGAWRGEIDPGSDEGWARWSEGYLSFVRTWAEFARDAQVDMFAVGVELRSWLTTDRAASFHAVIDAIRRVYPGLLTYAANWDDVQETTILGELDVIGLNAFFPLTESANATPEQLLKGAEGVRARLAELATRWHKPIVFTEFGYTTRTDPALRPWEWPDFMTHVTVDQAAQADAYAALLAPMLEEPWFAGAFAWRVYADPDDQSQEAEWGFSPRGKLSELVLRDAFAAHFAADGERTLGFGLSRFGAERVGIY